MLKRMKVIVQYLKDKDVSLYKKLLICGSVLYLISPADIVPDFIIGLGILDDITVLTFIWIAMKSELDDYENRRKNDGIKKSRVIPFKGREKDE